MNQKLFEGLAEGRKLMRVVPQSDLLTFRLISKLVIVDLILNGKPKAFRFALWKRSHWPGPTLDNGLHTRGPDPNDMAKSLKAELVLET